MSKEAAKFNICVLGNRWGPEAWHRNPPIRVDALDAGGSEAATFIFLHGFGDDAEGWVSESLYFSIILLIVTKLSL